MPGYAVLRSKEFFFANYPASREREFYNLQKDPYMIENSWSRLAPETKAEFSGRLANLRNCRAEECQRAEG